MKKPQRAYETQRWDAERRGVEFLLTFKQWLDIWTESGHLYERGCRRGQYVMARFGDNGPYAVGNVRICTVEENRAEDWGRPTRQCAHQVQMVGNRYALGSKGHLGLKRSTEAKRKMSVAKLGNQYRMGCKQSSEARARMREAWKRRKERDALAAGYDL